uniref:Uncharacterized protein LOC102803873 n=1 Tax=Saccoglossus kowalevskii TaxID=10224 RepID=A0ABM0MUD9_SACKO|nr:PREDICTED: uncharacterized protein LOC102803873 [Saccoglossus kowalevskii]
MHHTKRDPRVSPSDEEREVTDELPLVSVKSATQEKDPNRRILQKRKGKLDMDVKGTDEKTETDQTSSDVKLKSVLHKRQNYASFSDEPSNVKSELSPKPAKQVHLLTPVGESSQQNEEKTPRSISDILRTVSSNNQGQPERPMRLQRRSSTISPSSHYKRKTTMLSPYVRLDYRTDPEIIWKLLTEHWRMKPPNVLISVTGGAKDFILKDRLRALFHRGLMKAATSTGAWIITGGTAEGVMKIVGEAVDEEAKEHTQTEEKPVYALGIATWGIVDNKDALDGNKVCMVECVSMVIG